MVIRDLKLYVVRRRWSREIDDEVGIFGQRMGLSINEAQAVNLCP